MTTEQFTQSLAQQTADAMATARRSILRMQGDLTEALEALDDAQAARPMSLNDLDLYGNAHTAVAKDCKAAAVLIQLNAHAQRIGKPVA